jgi:hypothetical protein
MHVLSDPKGELAALVRPLVELRDEVRDARLRVHYFESTYVAQKLQKALRQNRVATVRILAAELAIAVSKVLFLEQRRWPVPLNWMFEELVVAGIPSDLIDGLRALAETPNGGAVRALRGRLDPYLLARGCAFVADPLELWQWLFQHADGRQARNAWAGEALRSA